ncbi:TFIIB-type zinc ribbon-containing protein [Actinokineospora cianjurensis]|uniref:Uncharacterized protein n=1 Tax=Actinokineospora cianjurensis TaxID=585224 RepID=A0A421B592_9PSEU|nr:TFIIB-type zinc ribbon-containing protein [Actinokineospora cianjurensis]RLK59440.1 hypothetical protein CLV68_3927 [Actinokineospora cianjurensis]
MTGMGPVVDDGRMGGVPERFEDPLIRLYALADEGILVVCPRCRGRAVVVPWPDRGGDVFESPRRLACAGCGHVATVVPEWSEWGGATDPYFGLPLWLRARCCGGRTVWAFNESHVDLLERFVGARVRERRASPGTMSLVARLPRWMKTAKNRDEVLRAIGALRASLTG